MIKNKSTSEVTNNVQEMYKEFFYTSYFKLIIPFLLIISYFMSSISVAIMSFVLYVRKRFLFRNKKEKVKKRRYHGVRARNIGATGPYKGPSRDRSSIATPEPPKFPA